MRAPTDPSPLDPTVQDPKHEPRAAGDPRGIVEITPEAVPAPPDGYVDLCLEDEGGGTGDRPALRPGSAAPAAGAVAGRGEPRGRAARRPIPAGHRRNSRGVLARDVAVLLAALLALGSAVAAFAPRARTEPPRVAPELVAPAPPRKAAVAPSSEKRGRARRSGTRAARTSAATSRPAAAPAESAASVQADAPVPLDTALREPELAARSRAPGTDAPAAPVGEAAVAAQPEPAP